MKVLLLFKFVSLRYGSKYFIKKSQLRELSTLQASGKMILIRSFNEFRGHEVSRQTASAIYGQVIISNANVKSL